MAFPLYAIPKRFSLRQSAWRSRCIQIRRSRGQGIPGYDPAFGAGLCGDYLAIGLLAGRFATEGSVCFDLGCSLGAASLAMRQQIAARDCRVVAVDCSPAMVEQCRKNLADSGVAGVDVVCADIRDMPIENASVVVLNFTLQFIPLADREAFLAKLYRGLLPGGILILSEKLAFADPQQQDLQTEMHHLFKKAQAIASWKSARSVARWRTC